MAGTILGGKRLERGLGGWEEESPASWIELLAMGFMSKDGRVRKCICQGTAEYILEALACVYKPNTKHQWIISCLGYIQNEWETLYLTKPKAKALWHCLLLPWICLHLLFSTWQLPAAIFHWPVNSSLSFEPALSFIATVPAVQQPPAFSVRL